MTMHPSAGPLFAQLEAKPEPRTIARAHKAGPDTSHTAARKHNRTGAAATNLARVVRAVSEFPGRTSGELAAQLPDLEFIEVARRLSDAKRMRHVLVSGSRPCRIRGTRQSVWMPNPDAPTGTTLDVKG